MKMCFPRILKHYQKTRIMLTLLMICLILVVFDGNCCPTGSEHAACSCTPYIGGDSIRCSRHISAIGIHKYIRQFYGDKKLPYVIIESDHLVDIGLTYFGTALVNDARFFTRNLVSVHKHAFKGQEQTLGHLFFTFAQFFVPPFEAILPLMKLKSIYFSRSSITSAGSIKTIFTAESGLSGLFFYDSQIDSFDLNVSKYFPKLRELTIQGNKLKDAPKLHLLPGNIMNDINLSNNQLTALPVNFMKTLKAGTNLDLSHNRISNISEEQGKLAMERNIAVNVNHNPIFCDCDFKWIVYYMKNYSFYNFIHGTCDIPNDLYVQSFRSLQMKDFEWCDTEK